MKQATATGMNTAKNQDNFFFHLEKHQEAVDDKETTDHTHILEHKRNFFKKREQNLRKK